MQSLYEIESEQDAYKEAWKKRMDDLDNSKRSWQSGVGFVNKTKSKKSIKSKIKTQKLARRKNRK
jgi:hypothetical protein